MLDQQLKYIIVEKSQRALFALMVSGENKVMKPIFKTVTMQTAIILYN